MMSEPACPSVMLKCRIFYRYLTTRPFFSTPYKAYRELDALALTGVGALFVILSCVSFLVADHMLRATLKGWHSSFSIMDLLNHFVTDPSLSLSLWGALLVVHPFIMTILSFIILFGIATQLLPFHVLSRWGQTYIHDYSNHYYFLTRILDKTPLIFTGLIKSVFSFLLGFVLLFHYLLQKMDGLAKSRMVRHQCIGLLLFSLFLFAGPVFFLLMVGILISVESVILHGFLLLFSPTERLSFPIMLVCFTILAFNTLRHTPWLTFMGIRILWLIKACCMASKKTALSSI